DEDKPTPPASKDAGRMLPRERTFRVVPASPIPKEVLPASASTTTGGVRRSSRARAYSGGQSAGRILVIQIIPHHNGEIFLSKNAVNQNPALFGFPFSGR